MTKQVIIDSCQQCPGSFASLRDAKDWHSTCYRCSKFDTTGDTRAPEIKAYPAIPTWCPLQDTVKPSVYFMLHHGFQKIILPDGYVVDIESCDDGCYITTEQPMQEACDRIAKFIGSQVVQICCDSNEVRQGYVLRKAKIVIHTAYETARDHILIWTEQL